MKRPSLDEEPATVKTVHNGKDVNSGKFLPGNQIAKGRRTRREYREAFDAACTPDDMRAIVKKAVQQAKQGDHIARGWLGTYALQRPPQEVDLTFTDDGYDDGTDYDYLCRGDARYE